MVNDGSTDKSIDLIQEAVGSFRNIEIIHQANKGLSEARNAGIKAAAGEYISFVDSDDWIEPEMLSVMYERAIQNQSDIAVCEMRKVMEENIDECIEIKSGFKKEVVLRSDKAIHYYFKHKEVTGHVCNKIFKRELFSEYAIVFPKEKSYEDLSTSFKLFWHANQIVFINRTFYNYLQRAGAMSGKMELTRWHLIENVYLIKDFLLQKRLYGKHEEKFCQLLITQLFLIDVNLQKNKANKNYRVLKNKTQREVDGIHFLKTVFSTQIDSATKLKYLIMKYQMDAVIDALLKIKKLKNLK